MPQLEQILTVVLFTGFALIAIGWLWLLFRAFGTAWYWGIGVLFLPPLASWFLIRRPERAGSPIGFILLGAMAAGGTVAANKLYEPPKIAVTEQKEGDARGTLTGATESDLLAYLKNNQNLSVLQMANRNDVTDDALEYLRTMPNLSEIDLNDTPITDKGMEILLTLPKLERLRIARTKVTADAVITKVLKQEKIKEIDVSGLNVPSKVLREWKNADPMQRKYVN